MAASYLISYVDVKFHVFKCDLRDNQWRLHKIMFFVLLLGTENIALGKSLRGLNTFHFVLQLK